MSMETPTDCQICGCKATALVLCDHLVPPKYIPGPREGKIIFCPRCPIPKYKWYQFTKKQQQKLSKVTPMINDTENNYTCVFCGYGYRN